MTTGLAIVSDVPAGLPVPYLTVAEAAVRMGCNPGHIRRLCADRWAPAGHARQFNNVWGIHPAADQRLRNDVDAAQRDRQQLAELAKAGVKPAALERAEALRDIIKGLAEFECDAPNPRKFREFYLAHLCAGGKLTARGIKKLSVSRLYVVEALYREQGISGLVRRDRTRPVSESGGSAALDYIFNLVCCGNRISLAQAIVIARGEASRHAGDPAWKIGSYSAVRLAIKARSPQILRVLTGKGPRAAKADCVPKIPRDFESIAAGDEYVGDERTLDIWCRVLTSRGWRAVRPKLTAWLDIRSRMMVGYLLNRRANSRTILGALKLAIRDHGKPMLLRTDWGEDYKAAARHGCLDEFDGRRISGVLEELRIGIHRTGAPYTPYAKPIESFFRGMKEHLDKLFSAFWGGCPSERHEDRVKYLRDNLEKLPTIDDVAAALAAWLDVYHRTPHSGVDMFGKSPLEAMAAFRQGATRGETPEVLDHLFREFVGPLMVRRDGIRHNGRWYGNGDARLVAMQGEKVLLGIQPDDQGRAMVCRIDRSPLFEVECLAITGRTREETAEMHKQRRRLMRPYAGQARAARDFMLGTTPQALLDNAAAGIAAAHGDRSAQAEPAPRLTVVRPALQEAISKAGRTPSESASRAVRTGTDDDEITLADMLGDDLVTARAPARPADDSDDDAPDWGDLSGESFDA